jgi:hypothetical protein
MRRDRSFTVDAQVIYPGKPVFTPHDCALKNYENEEQLVAGLYSVRAWRMQ